jgi:predicted MFS family arabinose efflux permease
MLAALAAAAFMVNIDAGVIAPLLPAVAGDLGTTVLEAGLIVSAYTLPYGVFQLVYGPLADRWGRLPLIAAALGLFALGCLACALAWSLGALALLRFVTGALAAAIIPGALAYVGDAVPYEGRQAAIGRLMGAIALSQMLSASIGGAVGQWLGWRWVFALAGLATLGVLGWMLRLGVSGGSRPAAGGGSALARILGVARRPGAAALCAIVFVEGALLFGGVTYFGGYLDERYHVPYSLIGALLAAYSIGSFAATRTLGRLRPRLGEAGMVLAGGLLMGAGALLAVHLPGWQLFPLGALLLGAGFIVCHTTLQTRATEVAPEARGAAISLFAFVLFLGAGVGTALMSQALLPLGYAPAYTVVGACLLLFAAGASALVRGGSRVRLAQQLSTEAGTESTESVPSVRVR